MLESKYYPGSGKSVRVVFKLNRKGKVFKIVRIDGDAGYLAETVCAKAITSHASYGVWPDDMIAKLGEEQEMTFTFYYQ